MSIDFLETYINVQYILDCGHLKIAHPFKNLSPRVGGKRDYYIPTENS
jgi:hypothetical protein